MRFTGNRFVVHVGHEHHQLCMLTQLPDRRFEHGADL